MGSSPHKEGEPFAILLNIRAIKKSGTLHFTRLQERHGGIHFRRREIPGKVPIPGKIRAGGFGAQ
jgi:hypothetical protein